MRKLLQRLWDIAADFANFMGGLGMRLVWLPKLHFSPGAEHVRTDTGPALFVLNHSWWMDAPMLCLLCRRRRISVVAAGEMFTGVRSLAMRSRRCIPVDRAAGADLSFFHEALRRLRAGRCVAIFPEGALNPTETLLPFKQGAALLALQAGADILLMPYDYIAAYQGVLTAVEDGTIPEERIDESVLRILRLKAAYGAEN